MFFSKSARKAMRFTAHRSSHGAVFSPAHRAKIPDTIRSRSASVRPASVVSACTRGSIRIGPRSRRVIRSRRITWRAATVRMPTKSVPSFAWIPGRRRFRITWSKWWLMWPGATMWLEFISTIIFIPIPRSESCQTAKPTSVTARAGERSRSVIGAATT